MKVLGEGELTIKLDVTATKFSASAKKKIESAGGTATETPVTKWSRAQAGPSAKKQEAKENASASGAE